MALAPLSSLGLVLSQPIYSLRRANVVMQSSAAWAWPEDRPMRSRRIPILNTPDDKARSAQKSLTRLQRNSLLNQPPHPLIRDPSTTRTDSHSRISALRSG